LNSARHTPDIEASDRRAVQGTLDPLVGVSDDILWMFRAANLTPREQRILAWRFLHGCTLNECSLRERGRDGVERARQWEAKALRKLRHSRVIRGTELHDWLCNSNDKAQLRSEAE